jgi:hypothetical protein
MEGGGEAGRGWATMRPRGGGPSSVRQQTERGGEEERRVRAEAGCRGARGAFCSAGEGGRQPVGGARRWPGSVF